MGKVKKSIEGMKWLKGFTNMAQSFTVAEKLLLLGGRREAQSAVLTLTDGKPSFLIETWEKVQQLKDKHVSIFMAPITEYRGSEWKVMRQWASWPWWTNLVRIPGLEALAADPDIFAQRVLVKFCPAAISATELYEEETAQGFFLIREQGYCGKVSTLLSKSAMGAEDCAMLTAEAGKTAFLLGVRWARGRCYAMDTEVDKAKFTEMTKDRKSPKCSDGKWKKSWLYDFYVLEQK